MSRTALIGAPARRSRKPFNNSRVKFLRQNFRRQIAPPLGSLQGIRIQNTPEKTRVRKNQRATVPHVQYEMIMLRLRRRLGRKSQFTRHSEMHPQPVSVPKAKAHLFAVAQGCIKWFTD